MLPAPLLNVRRAWPAQLVDCGTPDFGVESSGSTVGVEITKNNNNRNLRGVPLFFLKVVLAFWRAWDIPPHACRCWCLYAQFVVVCLMSTKACYQHHENSLLVLPRFLEERELDSPEPHAFVTPGSFHVVTPAPSRPPPPIVLCSL